MAGPAGGDGAVLDRVWRRIAERLERNGLRPRGRVVIDDLSRSERHALAGLLGRHVSGERLSLDLAVLDDRIRSSGLASGLVALAASHVGDLVDRPAVRERRDADRAGVWAAARVALDEHRLAPYPWVEPWLDDVRRSGSLARLTPERARSIVTTCVRVIAQLPVLTDGDGDGDGDGTARGDLASRAAGNAHALDDGTLLASIVLRAASAISGEPYGRSAVAVRGLWRSVGVQTDEVSTTVLALGLVTVSGDSWLDDRSAAGWESHLTRRDLRRIRPRSPTNVVFVCENPRVLEFAMESGTAASIVCTHGQPAGVVTDLLGALHETGAVLQYHGDFDWPGLAIANALIGRHGCVPWRMGAADYEDSLARLAPIVAELPGLDGQPVSAGWDDALSVVMAAAGRAVHEELVMDVLLEDLSSAAG